MVKVFASFFEKKGFPFFFCLMKARNLAFRAFFVHRAPHGVTGGQPGAFAAAGCLLPLAWLLHCFSSGPT
jgi:hypothetical protein